VAPEVHKVRIVVMEDNMKREVIEELAAVLLNFATTNTDCKSKAMEVNKLEKVAEHLEEVRKRSVHIVLMKFQA
jgi:metal-sulfur cluster biosynthetic enzyme